MRNQLLKLAINVVMWGYLIAVGGALTYGYIKFIVWAFAH